MSRLSTDEALELPAALAAGRAANRLRVALQAVGGPSELVEVSVQDATVRIPALALQTLVDTLEDLSEGRRVAVAPADLPVGTMHAARILGVSRPWAAELIDRGDLPGERVGSKRRVPLGALVEHRRRQATAQREALAQLAKADEQTPAPSQLQATTARGRRAH